MVLNTKQHARSRCFFGSGSRSVYTYVLGGSNMKEKVVLAYSGGLDTTAVIPWLKETFDYEVICCCVDCGQGNELDGLDERAKLSGASKL